MTVFPESLFEFDHLGIAMPTLSEGRTHLAVLLRIDEWTEEFADYNQNVYVQFGRDGSGICYEIVAPMDSQNPLSEALRTGSRVLNHIAYLTSDIEAVGATFRQSKCIPVGPAKPAVAYGGKVVQFYFSPFRFLIELIASPEHHHVFRQNSR
jgi:methylmalonyl-CoA/ethylmalonyl-CoA epimerase